MMSVSPLSNLKRTSPEKGSLSLDTGDVPVPGQQKPPMVESLMFRKAVREGDSDAVESILQTSKWRDILVNECDETAGNLLFTWL
jgi:hypothetical protein